MRKSAYLMGRTMTWPTVAHDYVRSFERARQEHSDQTAKRIDPATLDREAAFPVWRLDHLMCLTDDTGMLQHAVYTLPNYEHGYCTDDNARALILMMLLEELEECFPERTRLTSIYAAFLQNAFDASLGRFRNFMSYHREWIGEIGSEDSHGRALWALGHMRGTLTARGTPLVGGRAFRKGSARGAGFHVSAGVGFCDHRPARVSSHFERRSDGQSVSRRVGSAFALAYETNSSHDWLWFEDVVTYDNARLPHALILTGRWANQPDLLEIGLKSLRWLAEHQITPDGHFRPIGSNGFWKRGEEPASFDQQPVEAHAMICACLEAHEATGDPYWLTQASKAFEWFQGGNDLGLALYDAQSGGCRDGLHIDRVNQNQGAESTLAFLLSLAEMRRTQDALSAAVLEQQISLAA